RRDARRHGERNHEHVQAEGGLRHLCQAERRRLDRHESAREGHVDLRLLRARNGLGTGAGGTFRFPQTPPLVRFADRPLARPPITTVAGMAAKPVCYEVDGWGVGELWLDGTTVVWHELPSPSLCVRVTSCHLEVVERLRAYFAGEHVSFEDVSVDLEYESPFYERCSEALRAVPRGEV